MMKRKGLRVCLAVLLGCATGAGHASTDCLLSPMPASAKAYKGAWSGEMPFVVVIDAGKMYYAYDNYDSWRIKSNCRVADFNGEFGDFKDGTGAWLFEIKVVERNGGSPLLKYTSSSFKHEAETEVVPASSLR